MRSVTAGMFTGHGLLFGYLGATEIHQGLQVAFWTISMMSVVIAVQCLEIERLRRRNAGF